MPPNYIVVSNSTLASTRIDQLGQWYHHCERTQVPYIVVKNRSKLATVECDFMTLGQDQVRALEEHIEAVRSYQVSAFRACSRKGATYVVSDHVSFFYDLAIEDAKLLAEQILRYVDNVLRRSKASL